MNAQLQNNRPANPVASFNAFMQKHKSQLELALPKHLNADRMVRLSLTAFSQNPALQRCDPKTIFGSIIVASQLGLEIGVNGQGYLVPYKDKCTFVPGWKGLVDLANRGGRCTVWAGAVYEGDDFDYMLGDAPYCKHKPNGEFEESKLTHVYAIGRVKDSEMPVIEVWPIKKVHAHFKKTVVPALQPNHYSKKHLEAYAKKVALLQVLKYMPQSIEMANAVDVSYASESGKGVTLDGDFITVDNSPQDDHQEQNVQNSTENEDLSFEQEQQLVQQAQTEEEVDYAPTFAQIKRGILTAKSPAHLDVMEEQAMDHADKEERKQLMSLIKAQGQKFQPATEVSAAKKPEPEKEEAPPVEEPAQEKKPRAQTKKVVIQEDDEKYQTLLADLIERSKVSKTANEVSALVKYTNAWSAEQRAPLHEAIAKRLAEFKTNEPEPTQSEENLSVSELQRLQKEAEKLVAQKKEAQQAPAVNEIKSDQIIGGLKIQIGNAQNITELEAVAKTIRDNKPNLTPDHMNDVLNVYVARKQFLENPLSMFDTDETPWVDKAIAEIEAAKNQDEINNIFIDPMYEEQSDPDQQRITNAAQKRESELFGN